MRRYTNREIERVIDDTVHSARNRTILKLKLIDGLTVERIAEIYDLSPRAIDYILQAFRRDAAPDLR